jgi:hypothetical protein
LRRGELVTLRYRDWLEALRAQETSFNRRFQSSLAPG